MKKILTLVIFLTISSCKDKLTMDFSLTSAAFTQKGSIPSKYTGEGANISPPLVWENAPKGTKCFVLIVDDPDAPKRTWVHWVVYNIPSNVQESKEGKIPQDGIQGINDFGDIVYGGPYPPSGTHRYFFKLYALDQLLTLPQGATKQQVENAMKSHILGQTELIGTYSRGQ